MGDARGGECWRPTGGAGLSESERGKEEGEEGGGEGYRE